MKSMHTRTRGLRPLALVLAFALILTLYAGCGSSSGGSATSSAAAAADTAPAEQAAEGSAALAVNRSGLTDALPENRKIILNADVVMESTDFDAACQALRQAAGEAGGYLESSQQETPSYEGASRWTNFVFRIPADRYDEFLAGVQAAGNVTSLSESTQDITADYVDVEARIEALTAQQERLLTMMEQAGDLETLLAVQNQLTEVQYQLESYEGQKRVYDEQVAYSTFTVTVEEVGHLTEKTDTFAQRLGVAFTDSWRNFGAGAQDFVIGLVYLLPLILLAAAAALAVWAAVRRHRRNAPPRAPRAPRVPAQYGAQASPKEAMPHETQPEQPQPPAPKP